MKHLAGSGALENLGALVGQTINSLIDDSRKRDKFAPELAERLFKEKPGYNIMVVHTKHHFDYGERIHNHIELNQTFGSIGYEIYYMRRGQKTKFVLDGDGGYINWAFTGYFHRDGKTVVFY